MNLIGSFILRPFGNDSVVPASNKKSKVVVDSHSFLHAVFQAISTSHDGSLGATDYTVDAHCYVDIILDLDQLS